MSKKSLAVATAVFALMCGGLITKAEAFSITPDENGPTFILDEENNALKAIKGLEILNKKYDVTFISGTFEDLSPTTRGITTFYNDSDDAQKASTTLWQTLINFYDSSGHAFWQVEDTDGNLSHAWNIPFIFGGGGVGWWRGLVNVDDIGLARVGPFGASTLYFSDVTYANFTQSTGASVPEPLTILGTLTAAGFGIAMKRKCGSTSQN
ncbi:PEP-CTERM sorting domain-containing protein [Nostoc sp. CHAB 5844]|nr:PEP-CTERM sorting domain-containing protein [Nostoc sp. CHAB 5844]